MGILSAFRFAFQNVFFTPVLYGVIASLAVFSATWERGDRLKDQITDPFRSQQDTFDFIIVGGGSAGSVLANRLSKYHTVLLLEAGGESHPFQAIPALSLFIPNYPGTDYSHKSVTQTSSCLACVNKKYTFSQGKNLGGSGNLNYLIHLRGSPKDFDNWARITGDQRWSYQNVLGDFTASEHFVGTTTDTGAHGVGGPLQIEMPNEIGLANEWNWAGREMGYPHVDLNGKYDEGFDALYYPIKGGVRQATYRAFIQPVRQRQSLLIRKFATANKVLIRDGSNDVYGVQYERHGQNKFAFANKEVILSAGTLQTPKILMVSGIGPRAVLEPLNIPVKADLPVGQNLHDHISTLLGPFFINSPKTFSYDDDVTPKSFLQFTQQGTGPLTTSGFQATALVSSSYSKLKGQQLWPDTQLTLFGLTPHRLFSSDLSHAFGLREDILQRYFLHAARKSAFFILVSVARPESRGEVCIQSKDFKKPLLIHPKYYSDPGNKDIKVMVEGMNRAMFLAENTTVFRNCGVKFTQKCFPGCEGHRFRSDEYWECYARHFSLTLNDHVGTSQMGYKGSGYAVVDSELRVMGVKNLRVVDASVMPTIVGANAQAATIMIGEKASEFILREWAQDANNFGGVKYGPPPLPQYGVPTVGSVQKPNPNAGKIVIDDSLGSLRPPGLPSGVDLGPLHNYENYDSFNLLRNKGLDIMSNAGTGTNPPEWNSFDSNGISASPIPSVASVTDVTSPSLGLTAPAISEGLTTEPEVSPGPGPQAFSPPTIYTEVYDPLVSGSTTKSTKPRPRDPKSFDFNSKDNSAPPENLLGPGQDDEDFLGQPTPTSPYSLDPDDPNSTPTSTTEPILTRGPNGSNLILRRRKRPPNVTVHPRGHLGYEDPYRMPREKTTLPSISSTSIDPLPKDFVIIKQRRPVHSTRRRRLRPTTTTPSPNSNNLQSLDVDKLELTTELPDEFLGTTRRITRFIPRTSTASSTISDTDLSSAPSKVSKSVSTVLNRLRNFIPTQKNREKRGHIFNTTKGPITTTESNSDLAVYSSNYVNYGKVSYENSAIDTGTTTTTKDNVRSLGLDREGDGSEEILIDVQPTTANNSPIDPLNEDGDEDTPFMPMDMDPLPKIIISQSKAKSLELLSLSPQERKSRMTKFVRASR